MSATAACADAIRRANPRRILATGDEADAVRRVAALTGAAQLTAMEPHESGLYDMGVAWMSASPLSEDSLHRIARMRDLNCRCVYVIAPPACRSQLSTMGFRPVDDDAGDADDAACFVFDIATYKSRPEWFNSKSWAHPERWGKARW